MKITNFFKKNISLYALILTLSPIVDLLIGFIQRSVPKLAILGAAIRGLLLVFVLIYTFLIKKENNIKANKYIIVLLLYIVFIVIINNFVFKEIIGIIKFFFFPLIICCFIQHKEKLYRIKNAIYLSGIIYALMLLIPLLTNTALKTYDYNKAGFTGWFYSPNEISGIVSLIVPFIIIKAFEEQNIKRKIFYTIISLLYIFIIFTIGTKTPIFAVFITLIGYLLLSLIQFFNKKTKSKENLQNFIIIVFLIVFATFNFKGGIAFNNIVLQSNNYQNFSESLQTNNGEQTNLENEETYNNEFIDRDPELENPKTSKILNMIFSSRDIYLIERFEEWKKASLKDKLFGTGQIIHKNNSAFHKLIEIDIFDVFFCYGVVGYIIFILPLFYIVCKMIIYFIKKFKLFIKNYDYWSYYISVALSVLISSIAGHTLGAPAVSLILSIIIATIYSQINNTKMTENKFMNKKRLCYILVLLLLTVVLALIVKN